MSEYRSIELHELFKAMALAQMDIKVALKESNNPFFKTSYANLQSVIESSRPALCKNGLSVLQRIGSNESGVDCLITILCHSSGQWISSEMKINPAKADIQSLGSYITYLRRYCYASIVGVYDGQDDDGNSAVAEEPKYHGKPNQVFLVGDDQVELLEREMRDHQDIKSTLLRSLGIANLQEMQRNMFHDMLKKVREIIATKSSTKQGQ